MPEVIVIIFIIIITASIEVPLILRQKLYKELIISSIVLFSSLIIATLMLSDIEIPNLLDFIAYIYSPLTDFIFSLF